MRKPRISWALLVLLVVVQMGWADPRARLRELEKSKPATRQDVRELSELMETDSAPVAQAIILRTTDPALAPAILDACQEKAKGLKKLRSEDFRAMSLEERKAEIHRRANLSALIETLGNLKDKKSIPTLKKLLDDEGLTYAASTALSQMGDEAVFQELLQRTQRQKDVNLAGIKAHRLKKIVEEIDRAGSDDKKKGRLIGQIKGSRDADVNKLLKDLALHHPDPDVRSQAGLALVNSIIANPKVGDPEFLIQWASQSGGNLEKDWAQGWVVDAMNKSWDPRYVPALINLLLKNRADSTRINAARVLGERKVVEAVPYLEEVLAKDEDIGSVRVNAAMALEQITNKKYYVEAYESDFKFHQQSIDAIRSGRDQRFKLVGVQRP